MQISITIMCVIGGYLIGSISIPRLVTRIVAPGQDLEHIELKNYSEGGTFELRTVGATTASMVLGPKIGGLIGLLDILKGTIPTLAIRLFFPDHAYFLFIGAAIVVGHIWPIYHSFRGGGGLSPALGTFLVLDSLGLLLSVFLAFLIGMFIMKEIKITVLGGPLLFIFWTAIRSGNWMFIAYSVFINLIMIIAVIPDIRVNLKARREGKMDASSAMEEIPMGKMMKNLMDRVNNFSIKKN